MHARGMSLTQFATNEKVPPESTGPVTRMETACYEIAEGGLVVKQTEAASRPQVHPRDGTFAPCLLPAG